MKTGLINSKKYIKSYFKPNSDLINYNSINLAGTSCPNKLMNFTTN